jgi:parallel beta-helix repeat protein
VSEVQLRRKLSGLVIVLLLVSCGHSSKSPTGVTPPSAFTVVVSRNPADHADYVCDGVEDEVQINAAILSVNSAGGGVVQLNAGTFNVLGSVIVKSNVTLRGAGGATVIALADNAPSLFLRAGIVRLKDDTLSGAAKRVHHVTLEDFLVDGNRANQVPNTDDKKFGVYAEGDDIVFRRVIARNCEGYGFDPHAYQDSIPSTRVTIENCEAYGNAIDGFTLDMVANGTFVRNYSHDNDRHGINLVTSSRDVTISECRSIRNGATGLMAQNGARRIAIQTSEFTNNALEGLLLRDADACVISGNTFTNNTRSGIVLRLADSTTVSGNTLNESAAGAVGRAVVLLDSALVNTVRSNTLTSSNASAGIKELGTSDFNLVDSNLITVPAQHVLLIGPHSAQHGNILH